MTEKKLQQAKALEIQINSLKQEINDPEDVNHLERHLTKEEIQAILMNKLKELQKRFDEL